MFFYRPGFDNGRGPSEDDVARLGALAGELMQEGRILDMGGLAPSSRGARVRIDDGNVTVVDGPFAEAKEVIGGYAILRADSHEDAIDLAGRFLKAMGRGESEVRLLDEGPEDEQQVQSEVGAATA